MNTDRISELLDRYFDEGLSPETMEELGRLLLAWPQARELFWERARLNALLRQNGMESWGQSPAASVPQAPVVAPINQAISHWPGALLTSAAFACLFAACVIFWPATSSKNQPVEVAVNGQIIESTSTQSTDSVQRAWIAVLRKAIDVQWESPAQAPRVAEPLAAQRLIFQRGLVEIQTNRGATILIEGPADLELISDMEVLCRLGRLRVDVPPPAYGFLVQSPVVKVVDRGTSFAMDVSGQNLAEVHVIEGAVEYSAATDSSELRELKKGQAVSVAQAGIIKSIPSQANSFPTAELAAQRTRAISAKLHEAWQVGRSVSWRDPACLAYFDFEEADPDALILSNHATQANAAAQGTIIGCGWTDGRWPGKRALEFKRDTDRVRFAVHGQHSAISCLASVRLDSIDHAFNALLMSGDQVVGEMQWQISLPNGLSDGIMRVGRRPKPGWGLVEDYKTGPLFPRERLGTWIHLAFVWDAENRFYRQYVDGELVASGQVKFDGVSGQQLLRTGELEIGNWTPKAGQPIEPIRSFNGRMDEFAMFARALSPEEIRNHYGLSVEPKRAID